MKGFRGWIWVPGALTASRIFFGPAVFLFARFGAADWVLLALVAAMLSDVFDGVIARRLGIVTLNLRRLDSLADAWMFAWIGLAVWANHAELIYDFRWPIAIEALLLVGSYAYDLLRQGRIATLHAYSAKLWGFSLYAAAAGVLAWGVLWPMWVAFRCGLLSFADAMAIKMVLPVARKDVLSAFHATRSVSTIDKYAASQDCRL